MAAPFAAGSEQGVGEGEGGGLRLSRGRCANRAPKLARLTEEGGHSNAASCNTSAATARASHTKQDSHCDMHKEPQASLKDDKVRGISMFHSLCLGLQAQNYDLEAATWMALSA